MKIVQKINTKDIVSFNMYLLNKNLSFKLSITLLGVMSLILGVASIVYELITIQKVLTSTIIVSVILIILGVFALTCLKSLLKFFLKKRIIKKNEQIDDIRVTLSDAGLQWEYENKPNKEEVAPYTWTSLIKVVEKEEYFYIHVNQYIVLFIKKESCDNVEEVREIFKDKLTYRFKTK